MSGGCRSVLGLFQRCVAATQLTSASPLRTLSASRGLYQNRAWSFKARIESLRGLLVVQPAVRSSQLGLCTKTGVPGEDEYPPLPAYQSESEPESREVYIVQVKGLPWSCTAQDLLHFFSECRIREGVKGIHLTADRLGRPSGRAFVELEHEEDVSKALEKHRQYLGPRYVEVFEVTNSDAESILKSAAPALAERGVVMLRGLPFSATEDDVINFFSGLDIKEQGVTMVTDFRGRHSGEAFVEFSSQRAADEALQRDRELMGSRYIEVFPSRPEEIHSTLKRRSSPSQNAPQTANRRAGNTWQSSNRTVSPQSSSVAQHFIHMRGLPFQVSGEDIVKFFSPLNVSKILIECGPNGRPRGEADVYFSCHQDALAAMSRDRQNIGHRYIELFLNSVPDSDER